VKSTRFRRIAALAASWACLGPATHAADSPDDRLGQLVESISAAQDPRVQDALVRIDGTGRRLLALRSYLRSGAHLAERWSWTVEQISAFEGSPERQALDAEIERVRGAFRQANPGYDLWVNPQVRSLDVQVEHWNGNESVAAAADALLAAAAAFLGAPAFPAERPEAARSALESFLRDYVPTPSPAIAAPGLSPHGQMRAIDFQVQRGGTIVAGPSLASIASDWDTAGWTLRLESAVRAASSRFVGPLASPREPWHYTYVPEALVSR
jgi:hypothetical protein